MTTLRVSACPGLNSCKAIDYINVILGRVIELLHKCLAVFHGYDFGEFAVRSNFIFGLQVMKIITYDRDHSAPNHKFS